MHRNRGFPLKFSQGLPCWACTPNQSWWSQSPPSVPGDVLKYIWIKIIDKRDVFDGFKDRRNSIVQSGVGHSWPSVARCIIRKEVYTTKPKGSLRMLACLRTSDPDKTARRGNPLPPTKIEKKYPVNIYPGAQTHKKIQGNMFTFYQDAKFVVAC